MRCDYMRVNKNFCAMTDANGCHAKIVVCLHDILAAMGLFDSHTVTIFVTSAVMGSVRACTRIGIVQQTPAKMIRVYLHCSVLCVGK